MVDALGMSKHLSVCMAAAAAIALSPAPCMAQFVCGDTVGPGGKLVLTADIGLCTGVGTPALTVVGPVTLDMDGHQIRCAGVDPADGIRVIGDKARIQNGSVRNCGYGVRLEGAGKHILEGVTANSNNGRGIDVTVDRTTLSGCSATSNVGEGIRIASARNRVDRCVATNNAEGFLIEGGNNRVFDSEAVGNAGAGFDVQSGANQISRCVATNNDQAGFDISGSDNRLKENHADRSAQVGFQVSGDRNSLAECTATRNASDGFEVSASDPESADANTLAACMATSNGAHGLEISGDGNTVSDGRFTNSALTGIEFNGGTGNAFRENVAMENATHDLKDSTMCTGAAWSDNSFSTSNDPCIE